MARQPRRRPRDEDAGKQRVLPPHETPRAPSSAQADLDRLPVVEPGVAVEIEALGVQFLRDATEQDNFESQAGVEGDGSGLETDVTVPEAQLISDASLEAADQEDFEVPFRGALGDEGVAVPGERHVAEVDLRQSAVRAASLFDEPYPDDDEPPDSQLELPVELNTRQPLIQTDDPSEVDEARQREIKRLFDERVGKRLEKERRKKPR